MKKNNKGFTLAELLIVVAIIAVLVAIAIPVFSAQLEKSRESTDMANIRSAYATLVADYLSNTGAATSKTISVPVAQRESGWAISPNNKLETMIDGTISHVSVPAATSGTYKVTIRANGKVEVTLT